jgi:hypothetical protein
MVGSDNLVGFRRVHIVKTNFRSFLVYALAELQILLHMCVYMDILDINSSLLPNRLLKQFQLHQ